MKKFKVYLSSGIAQTILANSFHIEWKNESDGVLRLFVGEEKVAVFPPGGWHGVQDLETVKKEVV